MYLQSEARCPYCHSALRKPPRRKAMCPNCGQSYYVRSHPTIAEPVIVTAEEAKVIEQEWERHHYLAEIGRFEPIEDDSRDSYSLALSAASRKEFEESWRLFNRARLEAAHALHMGIYRNITHDMARQLYVEGKRRQAILLLVEVMFYDLCHVANMSDLTPADQGLAISTGLLHWTGGPFLPFDEATIEDITPKAAYWFVRWVAEEHVSVGELRELILTHIRRSVQMRTPVSAEQAWDIIVQLLADR